MLQKALWAQALQSAIDEYLKKKTGGRPSTVPAAPLKPLLVRQAQLLGLVFPPEGYERVKFVDFLGLFSDSIRIHRRAGQDTLVAKTCDAHLLEDAAESEANQYDVARTPKSLRQDVFNTFTIIPAPGVLCWYAVDQDKFVQAETGESDWISVAPPSTETAFIDRKDFAEAQVDASQKEALLAALKDQVSPLRAFSAEVKKQRIGRAWHVFHLKKIVRRISEWSVLNGIPWKSSWESAGVSAVRQLNVVTARETNAFLAGLMHLGPEDAKRVMVPLDIVLRLIRRD